MALNVAIYIGKNIVWALKPTNSMQEGLSLVAAVAYVCNYLVPSCASFCSHSAIGSKLQHHNMFLQMVQTGSC